MSRVLITGGAGALGAAVAKRLLADPAYDVRISDRRPAPQWMREGCEIHDGDLRVASQAMAAVRGCSHVIHLARFELPAGEGEATLAHTLIEFENALHNAVIRAAVERSVERIVYVSSALVFERAELFPTPEEQLALGPPPRSARGFSRLVGERCCAAAQQQHGLEYAICRPFDAYGPLPASAMTDREPDADATSWPSRGSRLSKLIDDALLGRGPLELPGSSTQTVTPTHVDDLAGGIIATLDSAAAANEDFNLGATRELTLAELAQLAWAAGGEQAERPRGQPLVEQPTASASAHIGTDSNAGSASGADEGMVERSHPSVRKANELLGWEAQIELEQGLATLAAIAHQRAANGKAPAGVGG